LRSEGLERLVGLRRCFSLSDGSGRGLGSIVVVVAIGKLRAVLGTVTRGSAVHAKVVVLAPFTFFGGEWTTTYSIDLHGSRARVGR